jgi:PAS domain-containing protein
MMIAISALGAVVGFGVLFGALAAQFRRLEQSQTSLAARNVELERATQAVRDSEERFRQLYEASSDWFWETDADHRRTYLSPNFEQITGLKAADYLGKRREQYGDMSIQPDSWREHIAKEDALAAASRELLEETSLVVKPEDWRLPFSPMPPATPNASA